MGKINARQKGCRGERLVRDIFIAHGFPARRGQQFSGSPDSPDVVIPDLDWLHVESKFVENLNLYKAHEQTERDCGAKFPVVFHKKKNKEWLVSISVERFFELLIQLHDLEQHEKHQTCHTNEVDVPAESPCACSGPDCGCKK